MSTLDLHICKIYVIYALICTLYWTQLLCLPGTYCPYIVFYSALLISLQESTSCLLHSIDMEDRFPPWFFAVAAMFSWRLCWANKAHYFVCLPFWFHLWSRTSFISCTMACLCLWGSVPCDSLVLSVTLILTAGSTPVVGLSQQGSWELIRNMEVGAHEADLANWRKPELVYKFFFHCRLSTDSEISSAVLLRTLSKQLTVPFSTLSLPCLPLLTPRHSCLLTILYVEARRPFSKVCFRRNPGGILVDSGFTFSHPCWIASISTRYLSFSYLCMGEIKQTQINKWVYVLGEGRTRVWLI